MVHACVDPVRRISGRINMDCAIINDEKKLCTPVDARPRPRERWCGDLLPARAYAPEESLFVAICSQVCPGMVYRKYVYDSMRDNWCVFVCVCMWIMLPVLHTHTLSNGNQSRLQKSHMPLALSHRVRCI